MFRRKAVGVYAVNPELSAYSKLRQQKLPAWQPILTAGTVIPAFFLIGIIFLPIGIVLFVSSNKITEKIYPYTDECKSTEHANKPCKELVKEWTQANTHWQNTCKCNVSLANIQELISGDVYFYYGLVNFYQNHRRYVKSRSDWQLLGHLDQVSECDPFAKVVYTNATTKEKTDEKPFAPCGAIANSFFNDTFRLFLQEKEGDAKKEVPMTHKGIVWPTDRNHKFKNPEGDDLEKAFAETAKPKNWKKHPYELDPENADNNGFENADFIVWMRTAALPTFRKLYRKLDRSGNSFKDGLPKGNYTLEVTYNYLVDMFEGEKRFILSTTSWVGGKNDFLGVAYIVVGSLCILLGAIFLGIHLKFGKS